ncbi:hypothetical protein BMR1_02g03675 [Babesia microti strain RI]|uniref:Uncharacterized protein n=1 Tax=Babesia microti (strain RI) TaxID=1133968 RepID=I7IQL5_BABMR|nr:hypothetical protein BMR1_02g03675 [Babesia microti strain RI]CCF73885.1 hypothetical protein BMR1_02g03675 [Babesia microti strain RI]|eukprot:XP_012648494.1 hypothetical protein BMR1_02g03675 [Babesia microti strain RI]
MVYDGVSASSSGVGLAMVKLTRLDKFRKAIRLPSPEAKKSKSAIKSLSQNQPSKTVASDSIKELEFASNHTDGIISNVSDYKSDKFGIKVKKTPKKKLLLNKLENSNVNEIVNTNVTIALSRGKRKREAKKLAFRKKFEFEKTCLDILKENRSVDKHGSALGSLRELKSCLDVAEKKLIKVNKVGKRRNKLGFKLRVKKRNLKQWSTSSDMPTDL